MLGKNPKREREREGQREREGKKGKRNANPILRSSTRCVCVIIEYEM